MSQTLKADAFGPEYWSYMAKVMARVLGGTVQAGGPQTPEELPAGVLAAAEYFFDLALQALKADVPNDPEASVSNYRIAADVIRSSLYPDEVSPERLEGSIRAYAKLVSQLREGAHLDAQDLSVAQELHEFFRNLAAAGDREAYRTINGMVDSQRGVVVLAS